VKSTQNYPLYSIGVVSDLVGVHPETIRLWEKSGVVQPPQRRSGKRFYSERDLNRLQFIYRLTQEGLTLRALRYYLRLYPCWKVADCPGCKNNSGNIGSTKLCWQEPGTYCQVANNKDPCAECRPDSDQVPDKTKVIPMHRVTSQQDDSDIGAKNYTKVTQETTDENTRLSS